MAGQQFMGLDMQKLFLWISIIVLGLIALTGSSCNPKQSSQDPPPATVTIAQEVLSLEDGPDLQPVADSICQGDFEQAREILQQMPDHPSAGQMRILIDRYFQIEEQRDQKRQAAYQEQLDELEKIKERIAQTETPDVLDVNDIDDTMVAVIYHPQGRSEHHQCRYGAAW